MYQPFRDLRITGLLSERCYVIEGSVLRIFFQLSDAPPLGWAYTFSLVWQAAKYAAKRPAGVDGDSVWIDCAPEEVRQYHLPELETAIGFANQYYRASQVESVAAEQQQNEMDDHTRSQLEELCNSLNPSFHSPAPTGGKPRSGLDFILKFLRRVFAVPARRD